MLEKLSPSQRVVVASIVSVIFFVGYEFFFGHAARVDANKTITNNSPVAQQAVPQTSMAQSTSASAINTPAKNDAQATLKLTSSGIYEVAIASNGAISQFYLLEPKFKDKTGKPLELFSVNNHEAPMAIRFADPKLNEEALKTPYVIKSTSQTVDNSGTIVTLTQKLTDLDVNKTIKFFPDGRYELQINMSKEVAYFISPGFRPTVHTDMMTLAGVVLAFTDDTIKTIEDGHAKVEEKYDNTQSVAAEDHYYASALFNFERPFSVSVTADLDKNPTAFIAGTKDMKLGGYIGPKNTDVLSSINPRLTEIVEYGYLTFMAKPMFDVLAWIEGKVGNWGWAIVIMTILVRLILFPLTLKGMISMNKMKELAPKMQELKEKYKGDPQKLNMHVLELYKKHNANPLSGCLPLILQIPIFFALYKVLLGSVELKGAPWILWISDLSEMDPYFILPILMGITMFVQQKITPMNVSDPMQEKILKYLPVVFTVFFVTFPAGLTLYWFVSNVLSVAQQYAVNVTLEKQKKAHEHA